MKEERKICNIEPENCTMCPDGKGGINCNYISPTEPIIANLSHHVTCPVCNQTHILRSNDYIYEPLSNHEHYFGTVESTVEYLYANSRCNDCPLLGKCGIREPVEMTDGGECSKAIKQWLQQPYKEETP